MRRVRNSGGLMLIVISIYPVEFVAGIPIKIALINKIIDFIIQRKKLACIKLHQQ